MFLRLTPSPRLFVLRLTIASITSVSIAESLPQDPELIDLDMEQLMTLKVEKVYGASRFEQTVTEAPASITIYTGDDIKRFGWRHLADVIDATRGYFTSYDRNYHYVGVRGFNRPGDYNSRVLLIIDGHPVNDNIFNTAPIGSDFPLNLDLVERIEIVHGPSSSLYGTSAFFGVINITTRSPHKKEGLEIAASLGDTLNRAGLKRAGHLGLDLLQNREERATYKGRLTYSKCFRQGNEVLLSADASTSDGETSIYFKEFDAINHGRALNLDRDRTYSFFGKVLLNHFTFTGLHHHREKAVPTAAYGALFGDGDMRSIDQRSCMAIQYAGLLGTTQITVRGALNEYRFKGKFPFDYSPEGPEKTINIDDSLGRWWGVECLGGRQLAGPFHLTLGGEYRDNFKQCQINEDLFPGGWRMEEDHRSNYWALFGQLEWRIARQWILNAGLRHDHYQTCGGHYSPRSALIWTPTEKSVFKLTYGGAFRAPNAFELHYRDTLDTFLPNPHLDPETIQSMELAYEQYYGDFMRSSLGCFDSKIKKMIEYQDGDFSWDNLSHVRAKGIEMELEGRWGEDLHFRTSYTYSDTRDKSTGRLLDYSPRHLGKIQVTLPFLTSHLNLNLEGHYIGPCHYPAKIAPSGNLVPAGQAGGRSLGNLTLRADKLIKRMQLSTTIYNIFNKRHADPVGSDYEQAEILQDGRRFAIKLVYRL